MTTYQFETIPHEQPRIKIVAKLRHYGGEQEKDILNMNYITNPQQEESTKIHQRHSSNQQRRDNKVTPDASTIFTSLQDNNTHLLVSNKPLNNHTINQKFNCDNDLIAYSQSISNDALLYTYDQVYKGNNDLRMFYHQEIRNSVCGLVNGVNSCIISFGPVNSGKSFASQPERDEGDNELSSILNYALYDLTNMLGQTNCSVSIKLSIYQVYMDNVHDLLSEDIKPIKVENKYSNNSNSNYFNPTQREIRSQQDINYYLKESINHRMQLSQILKVNELKEKSNLVISLQVNKSIKGTDTTSQIDFVEFASVNYGLMTQQAKTLEDDYLAKALGSDFDSLSDHIISVSKNTLSTINSTLTVCLKSSLKLFSNITLVNCIIPWEYPIDQSLKSIRYSTWLREEILKETKPIGKDYRTYSYDSENIVYPNKDNCPTMDITKKNYKEDGRNQQSTKFDNVHYSPIFKKPIDNNINFDSPSSNEEKEMKIRDKIKKKFNDQQEQQQSQKPNEINMHLKKNNNNDNNNRVNDKAMLINHSYSNNQNINQKLPIPEDNNDKMMNNTFTYDPQKNKDRQIEILNNSLMQLRQQNDEMNKRLQRIQNEHKILNNDDSQLLNNSNSNNNNLHQNKINFSSSQLIESPYSQSEYEKIKQENTTLKSDNIILREDINHLTNLNRHLEDELSNQRNRNLDLASENERILQEKISMGIEIKKVNESISKVKFQEHNLMESFNQRLMVENKMRDNENEIMRLREDKQRFEIEYRVIKDRYEEITGKHDKANSELLFTKDKYETEISKIEEKVDIMTREMDKLRKENISLRANDERQRNDLSTMEKHRDNYRDKYQEMKQKNILIDTKLTDIETDFKHLLQEKENEEMMRMQDDNIKKYKLDSKQKIMGELQMKIANYRNERLKRGNK